jgi:hypothetical protein
MPDHAHVAGCQLQGTTDLVGIALLDKRREHDGDIASVELAEARFESQAIDASVRWNVRSDRDGRVRLRDALLAELATAQVLRRVARGAEDIGADSRGVLDAAVAHRANDGEQDVLDEVVSGGRVAQVAHAVRADARRVLDAQLPFVDHDLPFTTVDRGARGVAVTGKAPIVPGSCVPVNVRSLLVAFVILAASCGAPITARSESARATTSKARWTLTHPTLTGSPSIASAGDSTYVLTCVERGLVLQRVGASGSVAWSRQVASKCDSISHSVAADRDGAIVGFPEVRGATIGAAVVVFAPTGARLWDRWIEVPQQLEAVRVAMRGDRRMVCVHSRSTHYDVVVVDANNRIVAEHAIDPIYDNKATCSLDDSGAAWFTATWEYSGPATFDGVAQTIAPGTWAFPLDGNRPPSLVSRGTETSRTEVATGWVTYRYPTEIAFVDRAGTTRWRIDLPEYGCTLSPKVIDASPTRLVAAAYVFCGQRGGTTKIGDIEIRDRSSPDDELASYTFLFDLDTKTMRARSIQELEGGTLDMQFARNARNILVFGAFTDELGLGTNVRSRPATYRCSSNLPTHAATWTQYNAPTPSCRDGFHLRTDYPSWPFLAALPLLPSL